MVSFVSPYHSSDREGSQTAYFWSDGDSEEEMPKHHPGFIPSSPSRAVQQDPDRGQSELIEPLTFRCDDSLWVPPPRSPRRRFRSSKSKVPRARPRRPPPTIRVRSYHEELSFWVSSPLDDVSMTTPCSGRTIGPILEDKVLHVFRIPEIVVTPPTPRPMVRDVGTDPMKMGPEVSEAPTMFEAFQTFEIEVEEPHEVFRREYVDYVWGDWLGEGEILDDDEEEVCDPGVGESFHEARGMGLGVSKEEVFDEGDIFDAGVGEMFNAGVGNISEEDEE